MSAISQFVISVFELAEAEGRDLRTTVRAEARDLRTVVVNLATASAVLLLSVPLLVAGAGLMTAGLMWWLESQLNRPLAAAITGLVVSALGLGCLFLFRTLTTTRVP